MFHAVGRRVHGHAVGPVANRDATTAPREEVVDVVQREQQVLDRLGSSPPRARLPATFRSRWTGSSGALSRLGGSAGALSPGGLGACCCVVGAVVWLVWLA